MKDDITWKNVQNLYLTNHSAIQEIVHHISNLYGIPKKIIRDQIKKELIAITEQTIDTSFFVNFIKYYASLFFVLFSGIAYLFTKKKNIESDVLYEELWGKRSLYSRFYTYIDEHLPKHIQSSLVLNFPTYSKNTKIKDIEGVTNKNVLDIRLYNILFETSQSFKTFFFNFFYFFRISKFKTQKLNLIVLYIKLLRKILIYTSQASHIKTKVLISASDYYWNPFKYYCYKQGHVENIFLIQHNFVGDYITNNFYLSCDYYFAHSQLALEKKMGFYTKNQFPIGSLQLCPFLNHQLPIQYDILIIDQPVHELHMPKSRDKGDKNYIITQYNLLLNNIKEYLLKNQTKNAVYILKPGAMTKNTFLSIQTLFKDIDNITFKETYGKETFDCINQSELIINMYSSAGVEAYGLDKKVLWTNYNNSCDVFKYDLEHEDLHILIHDTSAAAFEKKVNFLLSKNKRISQHYAKLKEKYMNIQENPAKTIADKVKQTVDKNAYIAKK